MNCIIQEGVRYCADESDFQILGIALVIISGVFFLVVLSAWSADFVADKLGISQELAFFIVLCAVFLIIGLILII